MKSLLNNLIVFLWAFIMLIITVPYTPFYLYLLYKNKADIDKTEDEFGTYKIAILWRWWNGLMFK